MQARNSAIVLATGNVIRGVVGFIQIMIIARLLTPHELGQIAIATSIILVIQQIGDAGFSNALIRFREVSDSEKMTFWLTSLALSSVLSIILLLISGQIALLFGAPEIENVLNWSALLPPIMTAGLQHRALSEKEMQFRRIVFVEICGVITSLVFSIATAATGFGILSVVVGQIFGALVVSILAILTYGSGWKFGRPAPLSTLSQLLNFGGSMSITNGLIALTQQIDILICGLFFPSGALAFYAQPRDLCAKLYSITNPVLTRIMLPIVAARAGSIYELRDTVMNGVRVVSSVNIAIYGGISLLSKPIVSIVFGPQWEASAIYLAAISIWFACRSALSPVGVVIVACGRPVFAIIFQVLVLASFLSASFVGARLGLEFVPLCLTLSTIFLCCVSWVVVYRPTLRVSFWAYLIMFLKPGSICLLSSLIAGSIVGLLDQALVKIIAGGGVYVAATVLLSFVFNRELVILFRKNGLPSK